MIASDAMTLLRQAYDDGTIDEQQLKAVLAVGKTKDIVQSKVMELIDAVRPSKDNLSPRSEILNEQHPDVNYGERAQIELARGLGVGADTLLKKFKKDKPSMDAINYQGDILVKNKDETQWRYINVPFGKGDYKEIAKDTLELTPNFALQAATLGGASSALQAVPKALQAASKFAPAIANALAKYPKAASFLQGSSRGLSNLSETIAKAIVKNPKKATALSTLGVTVPATMTGEYAGNVITGNPSQAPRLKPALINAALNAATIPLFGTGNSRNTMKSIIDLIPTKTLKNMSSANTKKQAVESILATTMKEQRGYPSQAYQGTQNFLGNLMSKDQKEAINRYNSNRQNLLDVEADPLKNAGNIARSMYDKVVEFKNAAIKRIDDFDKSPAGEVNVDLRGARGAIEARISEIEAKKLTGQYGADDDQIVNALKEYRDHVFLNKKVTPRQAEELARLEGEKNIILSRKDNIVTKNEELLNNIQQEKYFAEKQANKKLPFTEQSPEKNIHNIQENIELIEAKANLKIQELNAKKDKLTLIPGIPASKDQIKAIDKEIKQVVTELEQTKKQYNIYMDATVKQDYALNAYNSKGRELDLQTAQQNAEEKKKALDVLYKEVHARNSKEMASIDQRVGKIQEEMKPIEKTIDLTQIPLKDMRRFRKRIEPQVLFANRDKPAAPNVVEELNKAKEAIYGNVTGSAAQSLEKAGMPKEAETFLKLNEDATQAYQHETAFSNWFGNPKQNTPEYNAKAFNLLNSKDEKVSEIVRDLDERDYLQNGEVLTPGYKGAIKDLQASTELGPMNQFSQVPETRQNIAADPPTNAPLGTRDVMGTITNMLYGIAGAGRNTANAAANLLTPRRSAHFQQGAKTFSDAILNAPTWDFMLPGIQDKEAARVMLRRGAPNLFNPYANIDVTSDRQLP